VTIETEDRSFRRRLEPMFSPVVAAMGLPSSGLVCTIGPVVVVSTNCAQSRWLKAKARAMTQPIFIDPESVILVV
jgi:hypothetical protein